MKASRYLILGELSYVFGLAVSIIIRPGPIRHDASFSTYGIYKATIIPYALGIIGAVIGLLRSAEALSKQSRFRKPVSIFFKVMSVVLIGNLLTPYGVNRTFLYAHLAFAILFFALLFAFAIWLILRLKKDWLNLALTLGQFGGAVIALLSTDEVGRLQLLATGELVSLAAFAAISIRALWQIEHSSR